MHLLRYRISSFAIFFYITTSMFSGTSGVKMDAGTAWVIFGSAAGAVLAGAATVFRLTPESHKRTWCSNGEFETGPDCAQWAFEAGQLICAGETRRSGASHRWNSGTDRTHHGSCDIASLELPAVIERHRALGSSSCGKREHGDGPHRARHSCVTHKTASANPSSRTQPSAASQDRRPHAAH